VNAADLRAAVLAEDKTLRVDEIATADALFDRTLDQDLDRTLAGLRCAGLVLRQLGCMVAEYEVTRRTGEIGIRMASDGKGDILTLVLRKSRW